MVRVPVTPEDGSLLLDLPWAFFSFCITAPCVYKLSLRGFYRDDNQDAGRKCGLVRNLLKQLLGSYCGLTFALWIIMEHYFSIACPVSPSRFNDMSHIFDLNTRFFTEAPEGEPWRSDPEVSPSKTKVFVAEGTLLALIRRADRLNIWDQDTDLFLVFQSENDFSLEPNSYAVAVEREGSRLQKALELYYARQAGGPYKVKFSPERGFVQVYGPQSGHGDVWLWRHEVWDERPVLYNPDFTFSSLRDPPVGNRIRAEQVLPIQSGTWRGVQVPLPRNCSEVLRNQYGDSFRKPYRCVCHDAPLCVSLCPDLALGTTSQESHPVLRKHVHEALPIASYLGIWAVRGGLCDRSCYVCNRTEYNREKVAVSDPSCHSRHVPSVVPRRVAVGRSGILVSK